jgi:hypothetical protein
MNTLPQELIDELDSFFGDASIKRIKPTQAEHLCNLAGENKLAEFKSLLAELNESNDQSYDLKECLGYAIADSAFSIIKEIIEVQGFTPSFSECDTAMKHDQLETLDYLLSHGADPHEKDDLLIHLAAAYNQVKSLEILAEHGADNYTPLINDFIRTQQTQAAIYMLENGAVPNTQTLEQAAKIEDLTILKHLLTNKGMVPSKELIDSLPPQFSEAKHLLTKAYLQHNLTNKLKPKTKSQGMKI